MTYTVTNTDDSTYNEGDETFSVTISDVSGGNYENLVIGDSSVTTTIEDNDIDTEAPDAPVITDMVDTNGDMSEIIMSGTGDEVGNTITVYDQNDNVVGTTTVQEDGTWSLDVAALTDDSDYTLSATETDSVGNESVASEDVNSYQTTDSGTNTYSSDDFVFAGSGDDHIRVNSDDSDNELTIDGGDGTDTIRFDNNTTDVTVDLSSGTATSNDDSIELRNFENVYGGSGDDTITGDDANNYIKGGEGNDTINGGEGNDSLYGEDGNDIINGGEGNDTIGGGEGDDTLSGGAGNDNITGQWGDDRIIGGAGDDTIRGGEDTDTLVLSGNLEDYTFSLQSNSHIIVEDTRDGSPDGTDDIYEMEFIEFADQTVSTAIPSAPTVDLIVSSDSGKSDTDNHTNDTTPTFQIALTTGVSAGYVVTLKAGDEEVEYTLTQSDVDNGYAQITTDELGDGDYEVSASISNLLGFEGNSSSPIDITIDTTASDIGELAITDIVDNEGDYSSVTMHGTGAEAGNTITIYDEDGSEVATAIVQDDGSWSTDITNLSGTSINDNEFFKATETDTAGNETGQTDSTHYWHGDWSEGNTESTDDFVMAGAGDDTINTDDTLSGTNETGYVTSDNDDTNDSVVIDGGDGNDTVTFGKDSSEYTITTDADGNVIVTESADSDSDGDGLGDVTELRNIETVEFADGTYDVTTGNFIPTAEDDSVSTSEDTALTLSINDFGYDDIDNDSVSSVQITALPVAGVLMLNGVAVSAGDEISADEITAGNLVYTPDSNSDTNVSFDYKVSDGTNWSESSATTTITVDAVADTPVNVSIDVEASGEVSYSDVNMIMNGSFEDTTTDAVQESGSTTLTAGSGGWTGLSEMSGWTLITDEGADAPVMEVHDAGHAGVGATDGTNYMDLGETNNGGDSDNDNTQIGQVIDATDGVTYSMSFDFVDKASMQESGTSGEDSGVLEVYWGGELVATVDGNNDNWQTETLDLVGGAGDGSNMLSFKEVGEGGDNWGMAIDNIYMAPTENMIEYNVDVSAMLADTDGSESLSVTLSGLPTGATLEIGEAGEVEGTWIIPVDGNSLDLTDVKMHIPESADTFNITATATAKDSNGDTASASASDEVTDVSLNEAATSTDDSVTATEDTTLVLSTDDFGTYSDANGDDFTSVQFTSVPENGTLKLLGQDGEVIIEAGDEVNVSDIEVGNLVFIPDANSSETGGFDFRVGDGYTYSEESYTTTVNIDAVADAPTISLEVGDATYTEGTSSEFTETSDFQNGSLDSWSNSSGTSSSEVYNQDNMLAIKDSAGRSDSYGSTAEKTFSGFEPNTEVTITMDVYTYDQSDGWETSDYAGISINDGNFEDIDFNIVNASRHTSSDDYSQVQQNTFTATTDENGEVKIEIKSNTSSSGEILVIDNIEISGGVDEPGEYTYPIDIETTLGVDTDGSESLGDVSLSGIPSGATVYADGVEVTVTNGSVDLTQAQVSAGNITMSISADEDQNFELTASVTATEDSNSDTATATASDENVVVDDAPETTDETVEISMENATAATQDTNIVMVLDLSGSMNWDGDQDTSGTQSRLEIAKDAIEDMIEAYDGLGDVNVQLTTFSSQGSVSSWMSAEDAIDTINDLSASGWTNYEDALYETYNDYEEPAADKTVGFFISDGEPTKENTEGRDVRGNIGQDSESGWIDSDYQDAWTEFVNDNLDELNVIGIGDGITNTTYLDQLAEGMNSSVTVNTMHIVDVTELGENITPNVNVVEGTLADNIDYGNDGQGGINSIVVGGVTFAAANASDVADLEAGVTTPEGGKLTFDFDTGNYTYSTVSTVADDYNETFTVTVSDADGDTATLDLNINVDVSAPETTVDAPTLDMDISDATVTTTTSDSGSSIDVDTASTSGATNIGEGLSGWNESNQSDSSDTVVAGDNWDEINLKDGDDNLTIGDGDTDWSEINAGDGNDVVTAGDDWNEVNLADGDDQLTIGDADTDWSEINAGDGNDKIVAGDGWNSVTLGDGDDQLQMGEGSEYIHAGDGNDTVIAGDAGNDWSEVKSGDGDDTVILGDGFEKVSLGDGNDTLNVGNADASEWATISAGDGDDTMTVGYGYDKIDGGSGSDTVIFKGDASEYTTSTSGSKTYVTHTASGTTTEVKNVENIQFGGEDADTSGSTTTSTYSYTVTLDAEVSDSDANSLSDITIDNLPDGATLKDSSGEEISANDDGSYTVSTDSNGDATVTIESDSEISEDDLNDITSSVTSTEDDTGDSLTLETDAEGYETLFIEDDMTFDFDGLAQDQADSLGAIDMSNGSSTLEGLDVDDFVTHETNSDDEQIMKIIGDSDDEVKLNTEGDDATWTKTDDTVTDEEGNEFDVYEGGDDSVKLFIDTDVVVTDI